MFEKILVPLDGADLSETALTTAVSIAQHFKSELILCHVIPERNMPQPQMAFESGYSQFIDRFDTDYDDWAKQYLTTIKERYIKLVPNISIRIEYGNVANQILDVANDVNLIVMNTHGYSGFSKWILGSVTERVIGHATCPVLVVKGKRPIQKIMLPVDGSEFSEVALEPAVQLSEVFDADLTCFHVIEPLNDVPNALISRLGEVDPKWDRWITDHQGDYARDYFKSLSLKLAELTDKPIDMVLRKDLPADGIIACAGELDADLIVMSTHGRSGVTKWLLGSVAEKLLQKLPCHLLIIRPFL